MPRYEINKDIKKASTLPGSYYSDTDAYQSSKSEIFSKFWLYLTDISDVKIPGQVSPKTLLPGFLDEPLLLSRDHQDTIHCISNVCTHRANLVVEQPDNVRSLRCRYHGKKFELDGTFISMPEFEQAENFPTEQDHLPTVDFEIFEDRFIFVSLDPIISFDEYISTMRERISFLPLSEFAYDHSRSRTYLVNAHWALYCDNYLEGFHVPYVHNSLNDVLDYGNYRTELFEWGNLQVGIAETGELSFELPKSHQDYGQNIAAYYFWLFPNIMFNFYPWGLSLNIVQPLGIERTKVSFRTYVWKPELLEQGAGTNLDRVEREDEIVVENVGKGLKSSNYDRGRFSPTRERGVHQFHLLLARFS